MTATKTDKDQIADTFGGPDTNGDTPAVKTLSDFEGLTVTESGIEIPDAAGGLRDALKVDPIELHKGQRVHIVLECDVSKLRFDPIDKDALDGAQRRVHVFKTSRAAIVSESLVRSELDAQSERIAAAKAAAEQVEGQQSIDDAAVELGDQPWLGYDDLTSDEVVERVDTADSLDLVVSVEAYETGNGGRADVLAACEKAKGVLSGTKRTRGKRS